MKLVEFVLIVLFMIFEICSSFNPLRHQRIRNIHRHSTVESTTVSQENEIERAVYITPKAMAYLKNLKETKTGMNYLRMGVKAGGCSGMSYLMDFIADDAVTADDYVEEFENGIKCAIDPKSMLYLYGLHLDYSDELIGGGFKFSNPNSETSCGCGKSFNV
jgi:iron-sulfur cluster assembly accessory protein